jgi:hypothetical protein
MTWARLEDTFAEHPKIAGLSDSAFRLHVTAICYAARFNTDGELSPSAVRVIRGQARQIGQLVDAGVWDDAGGGTYVIHDFLEYNPSREETEGRRATRAEAGRMGGLRSGEARRSKSEANNEANALAKTKQMLRSKTNPVPTRPDPSRPVGNNSRRLSSSSSLPGAAVGRLDDDDNKADSLPDGAKLILSALRLRRIQPDLAEDARQIAEVVGSDSIRAAIAICKTDGVKPWPDAVRARLPRDISDDLEARKAKYLGGSIGSAVRK